MTNNPQAGSPHCSASAEAQGAPAPEPSASSCCGATDSSETAAGNVPENLLADSAEAATTCPVMVGTPVVKTVAEVAGLFRDHEGQRYWLCCAACGPKFDSDPAKYAATVA